MDRKIEKWMDKQKVPGLAACIVKGERIVWSNGYGFANLEKRTPFTPDDTVFQIASVSKVFTATAILQLWERGLLDLDQDVTEYLSFEVRNPKYPDRPITFRQLLTHSSSINDTDSLYSWYSLGDPSRSLEEAVAEYFAGGGGFWDQKNFRNSPPGDKQKYSNAGFALLGLLVEKISNQSLEDYLQENVYRPLEMNETSFYLSKLNLEKHACPYTYAKRAPRELCPGDGDGNLLPAGVSPQAGYNQHALYSYPTLADGMIRTSVSQLANFLIAMMNGGRFSGAQFLKEATVREMLRGEEQGLGWYRDEDEDDYWSHDGEDPGCSSVMMFNLEMKLGLIILANASVELDRVKTLLLDEAEDEWG